MTAIPNTTAVRRPAAPDDPDNADGVPDTLNDGSGGYVDSSDGSKQPNSDSVDRSGSGVPPSCDPSCTGEVMDATEAALPRGRRQPRRALPAGARAVALPLRSSALPSRVALSQRLVGALLPEPGREFVAVEHPDQLLARLQPLVGHRAPLAILSLAAARAVSAGRRRDCRPGVPTPLSRHSNPAPHRRPGAKPSGCSLTPGWSSIAATLTPARPCRRIYGASASST